MRTDSDVAQGKGNQNIVCVCVCVCSYRKEGLKTFSCKSGGITINKRKVKNYAKYAREGS